MHPVLHLEADRTNTEANEALEQALVEASLGGFLAHDDRAELTVVADEDDVLRALEDREERLGLRGLRRLVDQHLLEFVAPQAQVERADACRADDVC